jgi:hypothetical protein
MDDLDFGNQRDNKTLLFQSNASVSIEVWM